jgi:competence protein ComEC
MLGPGGQPKRAFWAARPAVPLVSALVLGIAVHEYVRIGPATAWVLALIPAIAAAGCRNRRRWMTALLLAAVFFTGVGLARREHFQFASDDIAEFVTDDARLIDVRLQLPDDPRLTTGSPNDPHPSPPKQYVLAEVIAVRTTAGWTPAAGQLPVTFNIPDPRMAAGQTIRVLGLIERPRPPANPGEFDWAVFYRRQRIMATLTVRRADTIEILFDPGPSARQWFRSKARHLLAAGFTDAHSVDHAVLAGLLLGDRDPDARDVRDEFQAAGVGYQLNVSGLHVAILAGVVSLICWEVRMRPKLRMVIVIAFVLLYAAVSTPTHSGLRSVLLTIALGVAVLDRRSAVRPQLIALAGGLMLVFDPLDLFSTGFLLSFAVVIALATVMPRLRLWAEHRRDMLAPPTPPSRWKRLAIAVGWALIYSVVVWLVTLPLLAMSVGQVSPWSPLLGLALLPVSVAALIGGAVKVVATLLWPTTAGVWAGAAGWPVALLRHAVSAAAHLPGTSVTTATPSITRVVMYYLLLAIPLLPWKSRWRRSLWAGPLAAVLLIVVSTPVASATAGPASLRVTLISLGAGQCAVIETPGGRFDLVDAGSSTIPDVGPRVIDPLLRGLGCVRLDDIFLSHGDFDHISAAGELAERDAAATVLISHHFRRNAEGNEPDQELLRTLERLPAITREVATGDRIDLGEGATIDVLWPGPAGDLNSNNAGLVLRLTYAGRSVLFPADIQDPAFDGLLQHPERLPSDVLVAPHHGSSESRTPAFLAAVHPGLIIASNAARLTQKQLRFNTMAGPTPLYRTSSSGAITVTITADGTVSITTFKK